MFYRGIGTDPTSCGMMKGGVPSQEDVKYHSTCPHWTPLPLMISGEQSTPVQSNVKGCILTHFYVNYHVAQKVEVIGKHFIAVPFPPTHKVKNKKCSVYN